MSLAPARGGEMVALGGRRGARGCVVRGRARRNELVAELAAGVLVAYLAWPSGHWLELGGIAGLPLALLIVVTAVPEKPGRTDTS